MLALNLHSVLNNWRLSYPILRNAWYKNLVIQTINCYKGAVSFVASL